MAKRRNNRARRRRTKPAQRNKKKLKSATLPAPTTAPALRSESGVTGMDAFAIKEHHARYHQAYAKTLLRVMSEGGSIYSVAREIGCAEGTIRRWAEDHPDFALALEVGRDMSRGWWEDIGRDNLGNKDFNSTLWMMNMSNRHGWSRFVKEGSGPEAPSLHQHDHKHVNINLGNLTSKQLRKLRSVVGEQLLEGSEEQDESEADLAAAVD